MRKGCQIGNLFFVSNFKKTIMLKIKETTKTVFYKKNIISDKRVISKNICSLFEFDEFKEKIISQFRADGFAIEQKEKNIFLIIKGILHKKYNNGNKLKIQKIYKIEKPAPQKQ